MQLIRIRISALSIMLSMTATLSLAQTATDTKPSAEGQANTSEQHELNLASLEAVFETVRDSAWDEEFNLEGWTAQRDAIKGKITPTASKDEVRYHLNEMLGWLGKSHFGIMPDNLYVAWEKDESTDSDADIGIHVRLVGDKVLVSDVRKDSAADSKGVKTGWELVTFNEKSIADFVKMLKEALPEKMKSHYPTMSAFAIEGRLSGKDGSEVNCEFTDANNESHPVTLKRSKKKGELVAIANLPPMVVDHEAREIPTGIGYFSFSGFFAPVQVMADLDTAIEIAEGGKGLIIDLRGNGGGMAGMTMGIGNKLANDDEEQFLGTLKTKDTTLKFVLIPSGNAYNGPVAVLTDECSASASEIMAGGLQAIKRARVFGTTTAGLALPSMVKELPNKDRLQFAFASYVDSNERCLEGDGVKPDVEIPLTRDDLINGTDKVLEAAVAWINQQPN